MANYDAKLVISTTEAVTNITNVDRTAKALDATLIALSKTAKDNSAAVKTIADTMASVVKSEREAAAAMKERANATMAMAKADAQAIANQSKLAESAAKVGVNEAKAATEQAKAAASTSKSEAEIAAAKDRTTAAIKRQDDANKASIANAQALAAKRGQGIDGANANREAIGVEQLAGAQQRRVVADNAAAASTARVATAQRNAGNSTLELNDNLSNSRYLLYDLGATYRTLSLAMLAIPAATTAVAASYEKDFAQVLRTTTGQSSQDVLKLRDDLKTLATQIPLTFGELSNIASLGAQLGLGADQLANFTDVTAKFVATTNVGVDEASMAFGRLASSFHEQFAADPANFFRKIGSAISELGTSSVATDTEIVAIMNQLSPLGAVAGFSAQGVAGLSAALASVRIRPELARGSFQRIMSGITASAEQGSVAMETYAKYMGMTGQQALELQKNNPEEFFTQMVQGLGGALKSGVPFTTLLDDIGVKSVRDKQFVLALANNTDVLTSSMALANKSFGEGTYLDKSSGPVFQTLAASIKMLGSSLSNLGDSVGGPALQGIAEFVRGLTDMASGVRSFIDTVPGIKTLLGVLMGFGAIVGVLLAVKSAQVFALAGMVAFQQVAGKAGLTAGLTLSGGLKQAAITMLMTRGASQATASALVAQNGITRALSVSTAQLNSVAVLSAISGNRMAAGFRVAGGALLGMVGGPIGAAVIALGLLGGALFMAQQKARAAGEEIATALSSSQQAGFEAIAAKLQEITVGLNTTANKSATTDWGKNIREVGEQAGVGFDKMVEAVGKGKNAGKELTKTLDEIAKAKGYASFDDWDKGSKSGFDTQLNNLKDVKSAVESLGNSQAGAAGNSKASKDAAKTLTDANGALGSSAKVAGDMTEEEAGQLDKLSDSLKGAVEEAFGFSDAQGAVQEALQKLGESLQKGGSDFSNFSEAGRNNIKALKDVFSTEAADLGQQVVARTLKPEDAAAAYSKYVDDVLANLASKGVDTGALKDIAEQVKAGFDQNLNTNGGVQVLVGAKIDGTQIDAAKAYLDDIKTRFGEIDVKVLAQMGGMEDVVTNINTMQAYLQAATGEPYTAQVNADTESALADVQSTGIYTADIMGQSYVMSVGADISPATVALQVLAQFAASVVNHVIDGMNFANNLLGKVTHIGSGDLGHVGWGTPTAPEAPAAVAPPKVSVPPPPVSGKSAAAPSAGRGTGDSGLGALNDGYNKVADAAKGAGDAGKQAGKDMANGIDDATKAVNDYASRLKTGLQSAFDKQYGMQVATDEYYKALNAIADKRKEDLKSLEDMVTKQKELNNARNADLVDANKAGIEKKISIKYGETDRAADYGNQEKTALDNAAAKQKDIDATRVAYNELKIGTTALNGYSNAAIANREALRGVESKMTDMIVAYAATGKSQQQVEAYARSLTSQFRTQTGQLGFARTAVANLQGNMSRYIGVVRSVPARVNTSTTTSGTGAAQNALGGVANSARGIPTSRNVDVKVRVDYKELRDANNTLIAVQSRAKNGAQYTMTRQGFAEGGQVPGFAGGGMIPGHAPSAADNMLASVDGKGLIKVRSEEFIQSAPAVKYWGLDFMNDINNMKMPSFKFGGSPSGAVSTGTNNSDGMVVALDASTMAAFAKFMNQPTVLYTDDQQIASSANRGNNVLATKGVS